MTGNTEKVATALKGGLGDGGWQVTVQALAENPPDELYDYDLVCLGAPSHRWLPPKPVLDLVDERMRRHNQRGGVQLCAPKRPGKYAVIFCTYSGPHTGIDEVIPIGK
jgi:hypothetical protein